QRGLARAVGTDQADDVTAAKDARPRREELPRADADLEPVGHQQLIPAPLARREGDRHGAIAAGRRREPRHPLETTAAALRLAGLLPRDVPPDEILFRRHPRVLLFYRALQRHPAFGSLRDEALVVPFIPVGGSAFEAQH